MHDRRHGGRVCWGPFSLDPRTRELLRDGQRIRLQDKPFELLVALVERPGEVLSREELRSRLWPADTFVGFDDGLNTAVRKLREALGDSAEVPQFIETIPRRGYRFIAALEPLPPVALVPELSIGRGGRRRPVWAGVTTATLVVAAATGWFAWKSRAAAPDLVRLELRAPDGTTFAGSSGYGLLSPDGRQIAFRAVQRDQPGRLWVQALDGSGRRMLTGTDGAEDFAWSPDERSLVFRKATGQLLRHDIAQGATTPITAVSGANVGMAWGEHGILLGQGPGRGLSRVTMNGAMTAVTTLDAARGETMHAWPQILADGRSFIYLAVSRIPENSGIYLGRFGETGRTLLHATPYRAIVAEPDVLVYLRDQRLVAQRFDIKRAAVVGAPIPLSDGPTAVGAGGAVAVSASHAGTLAYAPPRRNMSRETVWLTRAGQWISQLSPSHPDASFSLSPDGRWVVFERQSDAPASISPELWLLDVPQSVTRRVTENPGNDEGGAWSPDSRRFVYARHRGIHQPADLYMKDVNDPGVETPLLVEPAASSKHPFDWSPDGRFILYSVTSPGVPEDIWVLPLDTSHPPYPWLATRFRERRASFSANGRWVVYESDESGRNEIYVRAFDDPRARWQVSTNGGMSPQWRRDGRELYYISRDHRLMAVTIAASDRFEAGEPEPLFELRRLTPNPQWRTPYAVSADGQRFLVGAVTDEGGDEALTILLNWRKLMENR